MYEGEPDEQATQRRVHFADLSNYDDGGLEGAQLETAECVAYSEQRIDTRFRRSAGGKADKARIIVQEQFAPLYFGDATSLKFIGEVAAGILEHGPAFAAWACCVGKNFELLARFSDSYLGHWRSAGEFTQHILDDRGCTEESEHRDGEESCQGLQMDAETWARDLQRRGEISVMRNPRGGVWVFRGW